MADDEQLDAAALIDRHSLPWDEQRQGSIDIRPLCNDTFPSVCKLLFGYAVLCCANMQECTNRSANNASAVVANGGKK